jgi:hypothetical protein
MDFNTAKSILESVGLKCKKVNEDFVQEKTSARIEFDATLDSTKLSKPNLMRKWEELGIEALDGAFYLERGSDNHSFGLQVNHVFFDHCYFDMSGWKEANCLLKLETANLDEIQAKRALGSVKQALQPVLEEIRNQRGVISTSDLRIVI